MPDVLVMTATPIPRTAAMTVYGDLDVSVLDELPPGRTPIETISAVGPLDQALAWDAVRTEVAAGRQAYVVCPLIEDSEKLEVASAEETFTRLAEDELRGLRLGLLHGRMKSGEKDEVMGRFRSGRARRAGRHDGDRGRRRCPERHGDGDPRRRSLRHRPAASAARPGRPRIGQVAVLVAVGGTPRRREPAHRRRRRIDRRVRARRGRPPAARRGHDHEHRPEGPQRSAPRVVAHRRRADRPPARSPSRSSTPTPSWPTTATSPTSSTCCSVPTRKNS